MFKNPAPGFEDFHLLSTSSVARGLVTPTSPDYILGSDLDAQARNAPRDAGVDESGGDVTPPPPPPPSKPGDLNSDGSVGISDLAILLSRWNTADQTADLNSDGSVNIFDFSILLKNWGG
jgi:hypothetical protein